VKWKRFFRPRRDIPKIFLCMDLEGYIFVYARDVEEADELLRKYKRYTDSTTYIGPFALPKAEDNQPLHIKQMKKVRL